MTLPIKFANYAFSTLAVGCDSAATSLSVPAGHGARFPALAAGEYFYATLENAALNREIVKVTARVDDTLTVVRAQDNTTARSWNAGDSLSLRVNAAAFEDIADAANHVYTPAGTGAVPTTVQSKLREFVSVKDFGAVDGANSTSAFQKAADAGGRIYVPGGTYYVGYVSITKSCVWFGDGDSSIIIRPANLDTTSPSPSSAATFSIEAHNITVSFSELLLDGNEANQIAYEPYGYLIRYTNVAGTATSTLSVNVDNCTFRNATQACIAADGDTATSGYEELKVTGCRFINGRYGLPKGSPLTLSSSGYGPDYITLTDKVYATITGNTFSFTNTLADGTFSRTAIRVTFNTNTDNADGARAYIDGNYFYGCGRGERGTSYSVTGGTGTGAKFSVESLTGSGTVATALIAEAGKNYTANDVLTLVGGSGTATLTVSTVNAYGGVETFAVTTGGTGYTMSQRPGNDVGVVDAYARGRELRIANNLFEDCQGTPIRGKTNCDLVVVSGNVIDSCNKNPGINIGPNSYAQQSGRISIMNNIVRQSAGFAITVVGNAGATSSGPANTQLYVADVQITNNIIEGVNGWAPQTGPTFGEGVYVRNVKNLDVSKNMVGGVAYRGIWVRGQAGTYSSENINITNNRVEAAGASGIATENSLVGLVIVSNNTVAGAAFVGFDIQALSGGGADLIYSGNSATNVFNYGHYTRYWATITATGNYTQDVTGASRGFYMHDTLLAKLIGNNVGPGVTTALFGGGQAQAVVHDFGNSWNPKVMYGTAAPTTGVWTAGDIIYGTAPTASGNIGWVCTTAGTPGTWKTFGAISA